MIVKVMSQKNAIEYSKTANNKCVIVSITAPLSENPDMELPVFANNLNILDVFRMQFNDYTYKVNELSIPERKDFIGLKDFIDKYRDEVDEIIVIVQLAFLDLQVVLLRYLNIYQLKTIYQITKDINRTD